MIGKKKPRILYLDNESINQKLFNLSFKNDYEIDIVESGDEALKLISELSYDIILCDQRIQGMSGTEFMTKAKKTSSNLKFILITAYTDVDVLEKAINQVGIWKYVKKPWDKETLKSIIDNAYLSLLKDRKNKKTFDAIEYNENRYNIAMEGSDAGLWDWDLVSNKVYFSSTWKRIIGYKNEELENKISTWESIMHPDDLLETFKHLDDYLCGKTDKYEIEFRLKHKNGYFVHILARGVGQKNNKGKYTRITGTHINISEKYEAQHKIEKLNIELEDNIKRKNQALKLINSQLIQRNKFEHLISKISSDVADAKLEKIDLKINQALADINDFTFSDKSFIFQLNEKGKIKVSNEVHSKDKEENLYNNFNGLSIDKLPLFNKQIQNNEFIIIKDIDNITEEYRLEKTLLKKSNVNSLLMIPIINELKPIGCFGIIFNTKRREWNQEDISLLKFISEVFSSAIIKFKNEMKIIELERNISKANTRIQDIERKYNLLKEISRIPISTSEIEKNIILAHKIIINHGDGLAGLLIEVSDNFIEKIKIKNIITEFENEEKNLKTFFKSENNQLKRIVKNTIKNNIITINREIEVNYKINKSYKKSFDIASIPISLNEQLKYVLITFFPPNDISIANKPLLSEITKEIVFILTRNNPN